LHFALFFALFSSNLGDSAAKLTIPNTIADDKQTATHLYQQRPDCRTNVAPRCREVGIYAKVMKVTGYLPSTKQILSGTVTTRRSGSWLYRIFEQAKTAIPDWR